MSVRDQQIGFTGTLCFRASSGTLAPTHSPEMSNGLLDEAAPEAPATAAESAGDEDMRSRPASQDSSRTSVATARASEGTSGTMTIS
eukprot:1852888-Pleurochrysis_carterae.AAC.1